MIYLYGWNILINSVSPVKMMPSHLQVNNIFQLSLDNSFAVNERKRFIILIDWLDGFYIL